MIFLGLHRKPIKPLHRTCSVHRGHRCPLDGRRHRAPSREGLRSPGRKVNSESLCAPGDQPEKEKEGERKRDKGTRALMEQRGFNQHGVGIYTVFSSAQFSCSVESDSLQPHEPQHARPPCPSPTPGAHSDSHPLGQ